jgi:hypothetical protein
LEGTQTRLENGLPAPTCFDFDQFVQAISRALNAPLTRAETYATLAPTHRLRSAIGTSVVDRQYLQDHLSWRPASAFLKQAPAHPHGRRLAEHRFITTGVCNSRRHFGFGYCDDTADLLIMRIADVTMTLPRSLVLVSMVSILSPTIFITMLSIPIGL